MNEDTIYFKLKECAVMANVIEAAETGYIALDNDSIRDLDNLLLKMIEEARVMQNKKVSCAATHETNENH